MKAKHKHKYQKICWLRKEHQEKLKYGEQLTYHDVNLYQCIKCKTIKVN